MNIHEPVTNYCKSCGFICIQCQQQKNTLFWPGVILFNWYKCDSIRILIVHKSAVAVSEKPEKLFKLPWATIDDRLRINWSLDHRINDVALFYYYSGYTVYSASLSSLHLPINVFLCVNNVRYLGKTNYQSEGL